MGVEQRVKELSLDEISLLEEMKSNCLKKGQYIDDKAKDKFKMLCHLEDFSIAYYELLDVIKEVREYINKHCVNEKASKEMGFKCYTMADTNELEHIMKLLNKEK